jgi:CheY-like chemotaxis protein
MTNQPFDLVLMDWHMPEMDGVTAVKAWREYERVQRPGKRLPIIALTASVLPGDREACVNAGMDDFVGKPFTYDELASTIARWLPQSFATTDEL